MTTTFKRQSSKLPNVFASFAADTPYRWCVNHTELADLWNAVHTAWAADQPLPAALGRWRGSYSGSGKNAVDELAMPEPWIGDLDIQPDAITMGISPGTADPAFHHRGSAWPNTIQHQHNDSYSQWAATSPYFGDVWKSAHGSNAHADHRLQFLSAWTGAELTPPQIVGFAVFPWHVADWNSSALQLDPDVVREYVLEPIASTGAKWAFGFGKDWWELIEALDLPILDRLGDGGRPYQTQVDHRRWLVAEGPDGLRVVAMRMDSMSTLPNRDETRELRAVLESGPAGENLERHLSPGFEADLSAQLRELDVSYTNIMLLLQAIDETDLDVDAWQAGVNGDGVSLTADGNVVVTVHPEWADFSTVAPSGSSATPDTDGAHRLPLPAVDTSKPKVIRRTPRKEPKALGMCPDCFNVLNPDGTCPMECGS